LNSNSTHKFSIVVIGKNEGESVVRLKFIDNSKEIYSSNEIKVFVKNEKIPSNNLSIKTGYHFSKPYEYAYFIDKGKLKNVRLLPQQGYSDNSLRDPVKIYFFNKGNMLISIDEIELSLTEYTAPPRRIIVVSSPKGLFNKEISIVQLDPEKKMIPILKNKFIKLQKNDGQHILIDFNSKKSGLYNFNFDIKYFEDETERLDYTDKFELFSLDNIEEGCSIIHLNSLDKTIADKLLRTTTEAWEKILQLKILKPNEILKIIDAEESSINRMSSSITLFLGTGYLKDGNYEDAILYLEQYVKKEPDELEGYRRLSDAYLFSGDIDNSLSILLKAKKLDSLNPRIVLKIIKIYEIQNDTERLFNSYKELLELIPANPYPWYKLSMLYFLNSDFEAALNYSEKANELDMGYAPPYLLKALINLKNNNSDMVWGNILFFSLLYETKIYFNDKDDISLLVNNAEKNLDYLENLNSSHEYSLLSPSVQSHIKSSSKNEIREQIKQKYFELTKFNYEKLKLKETMKIQNIPDITDENQITLVIEKIDNFDVMRGNFVVKLKNISNTTLKNIKLINKSDFINFNINNQTKLNHEQLITIGKITVSDIMSLNFPTTSDGSAIPFLDSQNVINLIGFIDSTKFSLNEKNDSNEGKSKYGEINSNEIKEIRDRLNRNPVTYNDLERIKYDIQNIAYGDAVKNHINFTIEFTNEHFDKKLSLNFRKGSTKMENNKRNIPSYRHAINGIITKIDEKLANPAVQRTNDGGFR